MRRRTARFRRTGLPWDCLAAVVLFGAATLQKPDLQLTRSREVELAGMEESALLQALGAAKGCVLGSEALSEDGRLVVEVATRSGLEIARSD